MRKRLLLLGLLIMSLPEAAHASEIVSGTLNTDVWYLDTEVMINGVNLSGPIQSKSKLCFTPQADRRKLICFTADHGNINKWTEGHIAFIPPKNAPPVGVVVLVHPYSMSECQKRYRKLQCSNVLKRKEIEIGSYSAHPHITAIRDRETGKETMFLEAGRTYEITGYRFGDSGRGIYVNGKMIDRPDIVRWTYDSILFTPSVSFTDASSVEVHNGGGRGNVWQLSGALKGGEVVKTRTRGMMVLKTPAATPRPETEHGGGAQQEQKHPLARRTPPFADVGTDSPHYDAVAWAVQRNIVSGYGNGKFHGPLTVNRSELLKMLVEADGRDALPVESSAPFADVPPDAWFAPYVQFAKREKIAEGYEGNFFLPAQSVTIAEALKMAYRTLQIPTLDPKGDTWFARYLEHAQQHSILFDPEVDPAHPLSRQDAVWMVWKLVQMRSGAEARLQASLE